MQAAATLSAGASADRFVFPLILPSMQAQARVPAQLPATLAPANRA
ncbi:hypothetical protein GCM10027570_31530 [Streptomonospora sediminis]